MHSTTQTEPEVEVPPPDLTQVVNSVDLVANEDSKISGVSVYSSRAEVTRVFRFDVKTGQNQVNISGLPRVLDHDSFRVEGRGAATIHDVTLSTAAVIIDTTITSPELKALLLEKERTTKGIERCKKSLEALQTYLSTLNVQHVAIADLEKIVDGYDTAGAQLDDKLIELEEKLKDVEKQISEVNQKLRTGTSKNWQDENKLNVKASIGVFAALEGEVEIALVYGVHGATWRAGYDIRVDMQTKEKCVTLIYKGGITQNTGEDWNDVPLTLETATPTFGLDIPILDPWLVSIYRPPVQKYAKRAMSTNTGGPFAGARAATRVQMHSFTAVSQEEYGSAPGAPMEHRALAVSSKGNISATFQVPGVITIPSDGSAHNVTIAKLSLDATMSWVCVPKKDMKTHLNAKIKNASEYTLLSGQASVYVDGSFISRSDVPAVSPEESFNCPLGVDPSIRITYKPRIKKVSQGGFYNKTINYSFAQHITIFNSKSTAIDDLKIVDQVPVSEEAQVTVKLVNPALSLPSGDSTTGGVLKVPAPTKVGNGAIAQWDGADEAGYNVETLGKDGKLNWICSVPSQGKMNLVLQWDVTAPVRTDITGL